ncbi:hypothetical protein [Singulisphaera sp. PoT]|uniref:hypothetical protein n=1 Tax=Singulisphaera sp. PoT TaxID=3411797 RepID=UPI003BF5B883
MPLFKRRNDLAIRLLAVWIIVQGVASLGVPLIGFLQPIAGLIGIAVGVILLLDR